MAQESPLYHRHARPGRKPEAAAEDAHGAAVEDGGGASQGGEAGKAVQSPLPKFLVLPPGFEGQCACEIRVLPRLEMEADDAQALLLEQWRQASEVKPKSLNLKP